MDVEVNDYAIDSFIIEGLSQKTPLIDIFVLLTKQLKGIKKITIGHDPLNYASDNCKCQVDFLNHEYLSLAKSTLKSPNILNNLFNEDEQQIKIIECQKLRNNLIDDTVNKTTALMFENMQIDQTNIMDFILYLKEYINNNNDDKDNDNINNYKISKIRQYNNKLLVIFDYVPNCIKKHVQKGENEYLDEIPYFNYKGKNIPIIPKMKPVTNLGKYKERNVKISIHCLNQEDKENLLKIFENNKNNDEISENNDLLDKMAEKAYNNIINREKNNREEKIKKNSMNRKREREKEKINEREKEKDKQREKERDRNKEREKDRERKREREKDRKRDKERDYERRSQKERGEHSHERKGGDIKYKNINTRDDNNNNNNYMINNNNINNNINGLNINEKDLNQVASLFSNTNAMNIVKYLLENNLINNINNSNNNKNNNNNNNMMQKKDSNNNLYKNNLNDTFNNMYNQNNMNNQQLLNYLQSQGNLMNKQNQQQRMNNILGNNMNNNYQNLMNMNNLMNMDNNNLLNYFNNQRQFSFPLNEQFMNQFNFNQQNKRRDNDNNK